MEKVCARRGSWDSSPEHGFLFEMPLASLCKPAHRGLAALRENKLSYREPVLRQLCCLEGMGARPWP